LKPQYHQKIEKEKERKEKRKYHQEITVYYLALACFSL
jgi:hypothetical protein